MDPIEAIAAAKKNKAKSAAAEQPAEAPGTPAAPPSTEALSPITRAVVEEASGYLTDLIKSVGGGGVNLPEGKLRALIDAAVVRFTPRPREVIIQDGKNPPRTFTGVHKLFARLVELVSLQPWFPQSVVLVGPAGSFKSHAIEQLGAALGFDADHVALVPVCSQTSKADLVGYVDALGKPVWTVIRRFYTEGGLIGIDEIDAGNPGTLLVINSLISQKRFTWPDGTTTTKHPRFFIVAAANTYGTGPTAAYIGRNQLDAATLNRYEPLYWDYDLDAELNVALSVCSTHPTYNDVQHRPLVTKWVERVQAVRKAADAAQVQLVLSPRQSAFGALCVVVGHDWTAVEDGNLWARVTREDRERILSFV